MKNRLQQIEKSLGAERFFVLRQVILSFQPTYFMQIRTKQPEVGLLILF